VTIGNDGRGEERIASSAGEAFFRLASERLSRVPLAGGLALGDYHLNPDLAPAPGTRFREAAVLIPVIDRDQPGVLFTERTAHLPTHAGQIAFPGGKVDPTDADAVAAALREAEEEIGLGAGFVEPVGYLAPYLTGTGYRITPILGRVRPGYALAPNPAEVASVFEVPLEFLMTPGNYRKASRVWNGVERYFYEIGFGDRYIWGATAGIVRSLYQRVFIDGEAPRL
jgi:8-oxo-dGTP pyrophosphatase MutT (NUDIX family)